MRRVLALLTFEALTITTLHGLGARPGFGGGVSELFARRVEDAVASGLRYVALGLAYWMALSTVAYLAARLTRAPAAIRAAGLITLPAVRRIVDRTMAVGLTFGILTTPLTAVAQETTDTAPAVEQVFLPPPAGFYPPPVTTDGDTVIVPPSATLEPSDALPSEADAPPADDEHVVVAGENLWSIAADRVGLGTNSPSNAEIAGYWRSLIEANRTVLISGDPDLIYPGETLVLP